jgi:hypothetical protein
LWESRLGQSLYYINKARTLDSEKDLVPLLVDLSLSPAAERDSGGRLPLAYVEGAVDPQLAACFVLLRVHVDLGTLRALLAAREHDHAPGPIDRREWDRTLSLLRLLALHDSREAATVLQPWLDRIARIDDNETRAYAIQQLTPALGPILPPGQVDFTSLRSGVASINPPALATDVGWIVDKAEKDNQSLKEPSTDSIVRWTGRDEQAKIIPYLVSGGAKVNALDQYGNQSPLIKAARDAPEMVDYFLANGANVNLASREGVTPLMGAAILGERGQEKPEVVAELLRRGADVNAITTAERYTALHAAANRSPNSTKLLLQAGAPLEAKDFYGRTPLFMVYTPETARILLDAGADPNVLDNRGESPYSAIGRAQPQIGELMAAHGGRLNASQIASRVGRAVFAMNPATAVIEIIIGSHMH